MIKPPVCLETERLRIRRYTMDDLEPLYAFLNDKQATRMLDFAPEEKTLEAAKTWLKKIVDLYENKRPTFAMVIEEAKEGRYIGSAGLSLLRCEPGVQLFYIILPEYQNRGYATEAVTGLIDYSFNELDQKRIVAFIDMDNEASIAVAAKMGMIANGEVELKGHKGQRFVLDRMNKSYETSVMSHEKLVSSAERPRLS